jgi:hypothetical protein
VRGEVPMHHHLTAKSPMKPDSGLARIFNLEYGGFPMTTVKR